MAHGIVLRPAPMALVTSSSTAQGYRAANVNHDVTGRVWRSEADGENQSLTIDLGQDTAVDTITLHGLRGAQPDWQLTVEMATEAQGKFTGDYYADAAQTLLAGSAMPVSDLGRGLWLAPDEAPAQVRYIRLVFSVLSDAAIEVSRICAGAKIQLAENFTYGAALGIRPLGSMDFNIRGVPLIRSGAKLRGVGLTCEGATRDEVETLIMPFLEQVGNDTGVALIIDPAANEQRQNRMFFGFLTGDLGTVWPGFNRFVWNVNLVAVD